MVCERGCVKDGVWKMMVDKDGVWKMFVKRRRREAGGGGEAGKNPDTESKTRTPHKDVGEKRKNNIFFKKNF